MKIFNSLLLLFIWLGISNDVFSQVKWEKIASGTWRVEAGCPEKVNLLSELSNRPKLDVINNMSEAKIPIDTNEINFQFVDSKTYLRFPLDKGEHIYGLGLNFKTVEQRGRVLELHMDHYGDTDNGRNHAPVPFFVSSKGYGVFVNTARYLTCYVGTSVSRDSKNPPVVKDRNTDKTWEASPYSDNLEFLIPAQGVELIIFTGKDMLDVVRRFNLYNGGGAMPPKWGLGFWHRTPTLFTSKEVDNEVAEFEKRKYPLSVIGLEPGWMSGAYPCTYEWDTTRFANPKQFVNDLLAKDIKTNVWLNPGIAPKSQLFEDIKPYTASHTQWNGLIADLTIQQAKKLMIDHWRKNIIDNGVSGYKMDENDGYDKWLWPDVALFPSGTSAEQMRQLYGSLMQKITYDDFRCKNQRTYGLVRAGNAGTSSYPYVLYNDYYDHRGFITALINSSFIGVMWTPEVRRSKTSDEWLKRIQTVCFSPLAMINAWADGTKPWSFSDVEKEVHQVMMLRMRLLPYIYTAFANYAFEGIPPVRGMNLEKGYTAQNKVEQGKLDGTKNPYAIAIKKEAKDQFMFGENILVAPMFAGEKERKVILPQGKWFDFYSGKLVGDGEVINVIAENNQIPLFVKDGGIIPMMPAKTKINKEKAPLEIRYYGSKPSKYRLYDDDGETFNYEKGEYTWIEFVVEADKTGKLNGKTIIPKSSRMWSYNGEYIFKFMTSSN